MSIWTLGCGGAGANSSQYRLSVSRLKALDLGFLEYVNDYDEVLPVTGRWMDGLLPYTKDETLFHSPAVGSAGYGYALNSAVQGKALPSFASPSTTVTLFDSTDLQRNATDPLSSEPSPPRYGNRNTIAYLDGHVQDQNIGTSTSLYSQSQSNLKRVDLGMLMYSNDYDDTLPLAEKWVDELAPYVKSDLSFRSPAVQAKNSADYGYAFNSAIVGELSTNIMTPATTLSFFDSTILTRNATSTASTLPSPPRYGKDNTIAYADGHVHP